MTDSSWQMKKKGKRTGNISDWAKVVKYFLYDILWGSESPDLLAYYRCPKVTTLHIKRG